MARFNPLEQALEAAAVAPTAASKPRRARKPAVTAVPVPVLTAATVPITATKPPTPATRPVNVREIPLATFAVLAGIQDPATLAQTRDDFACFFARQPAGTDWRRAWGSFQAANAPAVLPYGHRPPLQTEVAPAPKPAVMAARRFLESLTSAPTTIPLGGSVCESGSAQITVRTVARVSEPSSLCDGPQIAADYWRAHIASAAWFDPDKEHLAVLLLDTKHFVKAWNLVSVGSLNEAIAHPREILRPAIATASFSILIMHNHPSGDPTPSQADIKLTRRIREAGELLQIPLKDHVIMGADKHHSLLENNQL